MQAEASKNFELDAIVARTPRGSPAAARYDGRTIALHWLTAALVAVLWALGQTIDWFPRGLARVDARSVHIALGATLCLVLIARFFRRATRGRRLGIVHPRWLGLAARTVHIALYALLAGTVVLGLFNAWQRGDVIFNLFTIPSLVPGDRALRHTIEWLHADCADLLVIVAGLHALAALAHHYLRRDSVLRRMLP